MMATHVPVVVRRSPDGLVLVGHVARANPHWAVDRWNGDQTDWGLNFSSAPQILRATPGKY